jgi:hypothetical protein
MPANAVKGGNSNDAAPLSNVWQKADLIIQELDRFYIYIYIYANIYPKEIERRERVKWI